MEKLRKMMELHPTFNENKISEIEGCILECSNCAIISRLCADACLSEKKTNLTTCIKNNLMCAEICGATARMLTTVNDSGGAVKTLIDSCLKICEVCYDECKKHSDEMAHCKICAEACKDCMESCRLLLDA